MKTAALIALAVTAPHWGNGSPMKTGRWVRSGEYC